MQHRSWQQSGGIYESGGVAPSFIRIAAPQDADAVRALATAFATSFAVEPAAFQRAFSMLRSDPHAHDLDHGIQAERALMQPFIHASGPWQPYFAANRIDS